MYWPKKESSGHLGHDQRDMESSMTKSAAKHIKLLKKVFDNFGESGRVGEVK